MEKVSSRQGMIPFCTTGIPFYRDETFPWSCRFVQVCVTFLLPPGIKGLISSFSEKIIETQLKSSNLNKTFLNQWESMGFCKLISGGNLSRLARMEIDFPIWWNLSRLDGLNFHPGKTGSRNHHLAPCIHLVVFVLLLFRS